jgi:hypothetical protein
MDTLPPVHDTPMTSVRRAWFAPTARAGHFPLRFPHGSVPLTRLSQCAPSGRGVGHAVRPRTGGNDAGLAERATAVPQPLVGRRQRDGLPRDAARGGRRADRGAQCYTVERVEQPPNPTALRHVWAQRDVKARTTTPGDAGRPCLRCCADDRFYAVKWTVPRPMTEPSMNSGAPFELCSHWPFFAPLW